LRNNLCRANGQSAIEAAFLLIDGPQHSTTVSVLLKIVLMIGWRDFYGWLESSDLGQLASIYVQPIEIPWWQVVSTALRSHTTTTAILRARS